jgi:DNA polymerase III epsilon subunit-like protein
MQIISALKAKQNGWHSKSELRQMRLKVPKHLEPVATAWGFQYYPVFDKTKCLPMGEKKPLSEKQLAALQLGQERLHCRKCPQCSEYKEKYEFKFFNHGRLYPKDICDDCTRAKEMEEERAAKAEARERANALASNDDLLILDTETSGLHSTAEICELAIINKRNEVVFNSLIKTSVPLSDEVIAIHGITNEMLTDAPSWQDVYQDIKTILEGKLVAIYNSQYDVRLLNQTCKIYGLPMIRFDSECVMEMYAQHYGEWSNYFGNYKWQKLSGAARYTGYKSNNPAHRALEDCLMTNHVLHYLMNIKSEC